LELVHVYPTVGIPCTVRYT